MVLTLFGDRLVSDLHVDARTFALRRTGLSRYVLDAQEARESISVEIWTTHRVTLEIDGREAPEWVRLAMDDGHIASVEAESCRVQFQHFERSAYILIVSRAGTDEEWRAVVFRRADLTDADLRACRFVRCAFDGASLVRADLRRSTFDGCSFVGADFMAAQLYRRARLLGVIPIGLDQHSLPLSAEQRRVAQWCAEAPEPPG